MNEPASQQEQPEEQIVTPADIWEQLSPDVQSRVVSLLAKMAYKCVLTQSGLLSEESDEDMKGGRR